VPRTFFLKDISGVLYWTKSLEKMYP